MLHCGSTKKLLPGRDSSSPPRLGRTAIHRIGDGQPNENRACTGQGQIEPSAQLNAVVHIVVYDIGTFPAPEHTGTRVDIIPVEPRYSRPCIQACPHSALDRMRFAFFQEPPELGQIERQTRTENYLETM